MTKRKAKFTTCEEAYKVLIANIEQEGKRLAKMLGIPMAKDPSQRIEDELEWWKQNVMTAERFNEIIEDAADPRCDAKEMAKWGPDERRVAALDGVKVLLDAELNIDGFGDGWPNDLDRYLTIARRFAPTASAPPPKEKLDRFSAALRDREKADELEAAAEEQIKKIRDELAESKRRLACAP